MQFNPATVEEDARTILREWVTSESLRTHCESVAASMRHMARKHGENQQLWSAIGLLHDMDYDLHAANLVLQ